MKLITWNVNGFSGRTTRTGKQADLLLRRDPDVVALQEVTEATFPVWEERLTEAGYSVVSTLDLAQQPYPEPPYHPDARTTTQITRLYFNLTASRLGCEHLPGLAWPDPDEKAAAFPEKYLATAIRLGRTKVAVHNAHLPPCVSRGILKVHAFEAIARRVSDDVGTATVLCGDFNAPWIEDEFGPNETGRPKRDAPRGGWTNLDKRWMAAELGVLAHPRLRDAYRDRRRRGPFPATYYTVSWKTKRNPKRYDYVFVSPHLRTVACRYVTRWAEAGHSDHAAVEADLELIV